MLIASHPSSSPSLRVLSASNPSRSISASAALAMRSRDNAPERTGVLRRLSGLAFEAAFGFGLVIIRALESACHLTVEGYIHQPDLHCKIRGEHHVCD